MNVKTTLGRTIAVAVSLAFVHATAPIVQAAPHLVNPNQMTARLVEKAQSRQEKVELFQRALATQEVKQQAQTMGLNVEKLSRAIPHLSDKELADLATRATRVSDVAAGHRHGGDGGLVILGVALVLAALVILAAVADDTTWDDGWDDCDCW
jgi:hypothetical protein